MGVVSGDIKEYPNDWRRCEKVGVAVAIDEAISTKHRLCQHRLTRFLLESDGCGVASDGSTSGGDGSSGDGNRDGDRAGEVGG